MFLLLEPSLSHLIDLKGETNCTSCDGELNRHLYISESVVCSQQIRIHIHIEHNSMLAILFRGCLNKFAGINPMLF